MSNHKHKWELAKYYGINISAFYVLFTGLRQFDHANTWLELVKSLLPIVLGCVVFWIAPVKPKSKRGTK